MKSIPSPLLLSVLLLCLAGCRSVPARLTMTGGDGWCSPRDYADFELSGRFRCDSGALTLVRFCHSDIDPDGPEGYSVLFHGGPVDGTPKTGSLLHVRNLYRTAVPDGEWSDFSIAVRGRNIGVRIGGVDVVCYTEPEHPWRSEGHATQLLAPGRVSLSGVEGRTEFRDLRLSALGPGARNPADTLPPVDESTDGIIRLQQRDFPVIDYHVHLKGDLTKEMAHAMSMNYGINYGVAPNAGEGGVGRMLADDDEVRAYRDEIAGEPFLFGVQGEGRKWTRTFSQEALGIFEYLFTDAMTISDHKGRNSRIYRPEEVRFDGIGEQEYMDHLVDQTVKILTNEPADIYANPTFLPDVLQPRYAELWTPGRVDRVLDVLAENSIAMEINPRYRIPSFAIIRRAKDRGIRFTFGTNNVDSRFGKLEYALEAIDSCGIQASDIWFPSMSVRASRPVVLY